MDTKITQALVGTRVLSDDGFDRRGGTVESIYSDRWGDFATVRMDDGSSRHVQSFSGVLETSKSRDKGIGTYLVEGASEHQPGPSYTAEEADEMARERLSIAD